MLLLAVVGAVIGVPDFNTEENLGNVVTQSAALGVLAIGQTFVILCGLIDLSVGQLLGLIVVLSCDFSTGRPEWFVAAIAMALGLGAVSGTITGVLNNWLRVHPGRVILHARIRRFRCPNRRCRSVTFTERLDGVARPFARVTDRVQALIDATGHAAGGLPGERLLRRVGVTCSADTILRHLKRRAAANRARHPVRVVGIDDWAA